MEETTLFLNIGSEGRLLPYINLKNYSKAYILMLFSSSYTTLRSSLKERTPLLNLANLMLPFLLVSYGRSSLKKRGTPAMILSLLALIN
jgi:hypothetical protein